MIGEFHPPARILIWAPDHASETPLEFHLGHGQPLF